MSDMRHKSGDSLSTGWLGRVTAYHTISDRLYCALLHGNPTGNIRIASPKGLSMLCRPGHSAANVTSIMVRVLSLDAHHALLVAVHPRRGQLLHMQGTAPTPEPW